METIPNLLNHFNSENFKCPYQAMTMKELLKIKRQIVRSAFINILNNFKFGLLDEGTFEISKKGLYFFVIFKFTNGFGLTLQIDLISEKRPFSC